MILSHLDYNVNIGVLLFWMSVFLLVTRKRDVDRTAVRHSGFVIEPSR